VFCCGSVEWPAVGWRRGAVAQAMATGRAGATSTEAKRREAPSLKARAAMTAGNRVCGGVDVVAGDFQTLGVKSLNSF